MRLLVPILLCLAAGSASADGFELGLRRTYTFGTEAHAPTFFDLNQDGNLDCLVANASVDSVTIRFGDGFGNFGPAVRFVAGDFPWAMGIADVGGDGLPDLVVTNRNANSVSVFRGVFGGNFLLSTKVDFPTGIMPYDLAIGDVTGDGRLDVVTANLGASTVTVLTGGAPGTGLTGESQTLATGAGPLSVVVGDIDGNGTTDILTANTNASTVSLFRSLATGGFAPKVDIATALHPHYLRLGDVDNDGDLDLVTLARYPGKLSLLLNNGNGGFPFHDDLAVVDEATALELDDLNGDGIPDAAFSTTLSTDITVYLGSGFSFYNPQTLGPGQGSNFDLTLADVDNDGRRDIVVAAQSWKLVAMLAARSPFGAHQDYAAGTDPRDVAVGDLNGDTFPDIASANNGSIDASVLLNAGDGTFPAHTEYPATKSPSIVRLGDVDADGDRELVVGTYSAVLGDTGRVMTFPNLGNGTFDARREFDLVANDGIGGIALGKIDGDPYLDLVDTHFNGNTARVWRGTASGGFFAPAPPFATFLQPAGVILVDLNADTALDIVYAAFGSSAISRYLGDGAGNFAGPLNFTTGSNGPLDLASGDLDGDGKLDLAVVNVTSHTISLLRGNGAGGFDPPTILNVQATGGIAIRDVNRDGIVDLLYGAADALMTRYGEGGGVFAAPLPSAATGNVFGLALDDLDKNGTIDAVRGLAPAWAAVFYGLQQTRTVLTVTPNPVVHNSLLTLTAAVTPVAPDSSDPSGSVRFFDGLTNLGSTQITNGVATLTLAATRNWERTYHAEYQGDFRFHGSYSRPVTVLTYTPNVAVDPALTLMLALTPARQPSSGELAMRFTLPGSEPAQLAVFDVRGRLLRSLDVGDRGPGTHVANLGNGLRPGVYLVRLAQGSLAVTTRAVVL